MLQLLGQSLRQLLAEKLGLKVCQAACPVFCLSDCTVMLSLDGCEIHSRVVCRLRTSGMLSSYSTTPCPHCRLPLPAPSPPLPLYTLRIIIYAAAVATLMWLQVWLFLFVALSILAPHEKCELFATFCAELAI